MLYEVIFLIQETFFAKTFVTVKYESSQVEES